MAIEFDKLTMLAQVGKPVGLDGSCRVIPLGETLKTVSLPHKLYIGNERGVEEITLISVKDAGKGILKAKFDGVNNRNDADLLKNRKLYLETEKLPEVGDDEYYFHQLIGLKVVTESGDEWGEVVDVFNYPTTDALEIKKMSGKKITYPFRKETTIEVDLEGKKIVIERELLEELL